MLHVEAIEGSEKFFQPGPYDLFERRTAKVLPPRMPTYRSHGLMIPLSIYCTAYVEDSRNSIVQ